MTTYSELEPVESIPPGDPTPEPLMDIPTTDLGVDPPPFGWVGNVKKLTGGEIGIIRKHIGTGMEENPMLWMMYAAVAFARRYDRERYPWSLAERLTMEELDIPRKKPDAEEVDPT